MISFAGYEGVENFVEILANHLMKLLNERDRDYSSSDSNASSLDTNKYTQNGDTNGVVPRKRLKITKDCTDYKTTKVPQPNICPDGDTCNNNMTSDLAGLLPWKQPINGSVENK